MWTRRRACVGKQEDGVVGVGRVGRDEEKHNSVCVCVCVRQCYITVMVLVVAAYSVVSVSGYGGVTEA